MALSSSGWLNKIDESDSFCACLTWQKHWVTYSKKTWPAQCAVAGCPNKPDIAARIGHPDVPDEKIIPMCIKCTVKPQAFNLKGGTSLVSAGRTENCGY